MINTVHIFRTKYGEYVLKHEVEIAAAKVLQKCFYSKREDVKALARFVLAVFEEKAKLQNANQ